MSELSIRHATAEELPVVAVLFREYASIPGVGECLASFENEVGNLPGRYTNILIARVGDQPVGCCALRPLSDEAMELKRLYVRPQARGTGAGRGLVKAILEIAAERGARAVRLDTLPSMTEAIQLYESLGFEEIERYYPAAPPNAKFFEHKLPAKV